MIIPEVICHMDIREEIIQRVKEALAGRVDWQTETVVEDVLTIQLNKYEVQERCTEVAIADTNAEKQLKTFITTKRIEGLSEATLRRYAEENMRLINFLKKQLHEVTTYDLRFYLSCRREQGR